MKNALQNVSGLEALLGTMRSRLSLANYEESTIRNYLRVVRELGICYKKDPTELEAEEVYEYLVYLKDNRKSSWKTIHQKAYGLRYLYREVLDRSETKIFPFQPLRFPRDLEFGQNLPAHSQDLVPRNLHRWLHFRPGQLFGYDCFVDQRHIDFLWHPGRYGRAIQTELY